MYDLSDHNPRLKCLKWLRDHVAYIGDDCLIWPFSCDDKGYPQVPVGQQKVRKANRVMCILAHGEPPTAKHQAAHSCGNESCVNPRHLSWKTQSENERDKIAHGTIVRQTWGKWGKLKPDQVRQILSDRETPSTVYAEQYGVNREAIEWHRRRPRPSHRRLSA